MSLSSSEIPQRNLAPDISPKAVAVTVKNFPDIQNISIEAQNASLATAVKDVTQIDGKYIIEILNQILIELKTINHQLHEMPSATPQTNQDIDEIKNSFINLEYKEL